MKTICYFIFFGPLFVSAQINESDTLRIKASLSVTGFWQGGNVETLIFRSRADFSVRPSKKWVFKSKNSYVYQAFGREKADEDILSLNFLYFNPDKKIYPLALGFVSTNFRREIDLRYLFGGGFTYQVFHKKTDWLKFSLSCEYEKTEFVRANFNRPEFNDEATINTLRSTIWVHGKYHLFRKKVILNHESYFQPSLKNSKNYRWQADIGLELPIWKFLNFKINYLHTFESIVIESQQQQDKFLTFGLNLKSWTP